MTVKVRKLSKKPGPVQTFTTSAANSAHFVVVELRHMFYTPAGSLG